MGLTAVRAALLDAGIEFKRVETAHVGTALVGMAAGRMMLRQLGSHGLAVAQVENASASGCAALRGAALELACGAADVALVVGVDKFGPANRASDRDGVSRLSPTAGVPAVKFALIAREYLDKWGLPVEAMARVAVKNHRNAARNPFAQFRKPRTLEQVLASPKVAGDLTVQQCCPRGDGAAALVLVTQAGARRLGLPRSRLVAVKSSTCVSEQLPPADHDEHAVVEMVRRSATLAFEQASLGPRDLDMLELHDAFSAEELIYSEAIGISAAGQAAFDLERGETEIGGRCAVNASGGLIGMGHPIGPTGVGQVAELVRQLREEAGDRQHPGARIAMAHMIGLGSVAYAHILQAH
jgi:acetyl-CoA acetyltransferase